MLILMLVTTGGITAYISSVHETPAYDRICTFVKREKPNPGTAAFQAAPRNWTENVHSRLSLQPLAKFRQTLHYYWILVINRINRAVKKIFGQQQQYFTVASFTGRANANQIDILLLA